MLCSNGEATWSQVFRARQTDIYCRQTGRSWRENECGLTLIISAFTQWEALQKWHMDTTGLWISLNTSAIWLGVFLYMHTCDSTPCPFFHSECILQSALPRYVGIRPHRSLASCPNQSADSWNRQLLSWPLIPNGYLSHCSCTAS